MSSGCPVWLDMHGDLHGRGLELSGETLAEQQAAAYELAQELGIVPRTNAAPSRFPGRIIIERPSHPMDPSPAAAPHGSDPARG